MTRISSKDLGFESGEGRGSGEEMDMDADTLSFLAQGGLATAEETENAGREGLSSKGLNKTPNQGLSFKQGRRTPWCCGNDA